MTVKVDPLSDLAFHRDRSTMGSDDPLNNGSAHSVTASFRACPRWIEAVEALKEMRQMLRGNSGPGITDGKHGLVKALVSQTA